MKAEICYQAIGYIRTPFDQLSEMPIQPCGAVGVQGIIELDPDYLAGLIDLDGFSHLILLYHFHKVKGYKLYVVPFLDDKPHGIFATRAPIRPNAIGFSIVKLIRIEDELIYFDGADMVDGTPLIDIKPFFPKYDNQQNVKFGWLEDRPDVDITQIKSDARFNSEKCKGVNRCEKG